MQINKLIFYNVDFGVDSEYMYLQLELLMVVFILPEIKLLLKKPILQITSNNRINFH